MIPAPGLIAVAACDDMGNKLRKIGITKQEKQKEICQAQSDKPFEVGLPVAPIVHEHDNEQCRVDLELNGNAKQHVGEEAIAWLPVKNINRQDTEQHGESVELSALQFELNAIGKNGDSKQEQDDRTAILFDNEGWEKECQDKIADDGDDRNHVIIDWIRDQ